MGLIKQIEDLAEARGFSFMYGDEQQQNYEVDELDVDVRPVVALMPLVSTGAYEDGRLVEREMSGIISLGLKGGGEAPPPEDPPRWGAFDGETSAAYLDTQELGTSYSLVFYFKFNASAVYTLLGDTVSDSYGLRIEAGKLTHNVGGTEAVCGLNTPLIDAAEYKVTIDRVGSRVTFGLYDAEGNVQQYDADALPSGAHGGVVAYGDGTAYLELAQPVTITDGDYVEWICTPEAIGNYMSVFGEKATFSYLRYSSNKERNSFEGETLTNSDNFVFNHNLDLQDGDSHYFRFGFSKMRPYMYIDNRYFTSLADVSDNRLYIRYIFAGYTQRYFRGTLEYFAITKSGNKVVELYCNNPIDSITGAAATNNGITFKEVTDYAPQSTIDSLTKTVYQYDSGELVIDPQYPKPADAVALTQDGYKGVGIEEPAAAFAPDLMGMFTDAQGDEQYSSAMLAYFKINADKYEFYDNDCRLGGASGEVIPSNGITTGDPVSGAAESVALSGFTEQSTRDETRREKYDNRLAYLTRELKNLIHDLAELDGVEMRSDHIIEQVNRYDANLEFMVAEIAFRYEDEAADC